MKLGDELWEVILGASGTHPATHIAADGFSVVHGGKDDLDVDAFGLDAVMALIADVPERSWR